MAKQVLYPCVAHVLYKNVRKFEFLCIVNCKTSAIKKCLIMIQDTWNPEKVYNVQ